MKKEIKKIKKLKKRIIVVGTNHAGTTCINELVKLRENNKEFEIVTYDRNSNISFLGCGMALWIGGVVAESKGLFYSTPETLRSKNVEVFMEHEILQVDEKNKTITVFDIKNKRTFEDKFDKLIIATGSIPLQPKLPGYDLKNIISPKLFQDAQFTKSKIKDKKIKDVVVVGAGYIGVELAEAFKQAGKNVHLVDKADGPISNYYDKEFTKLMTDTLLKNKINLHFNQEVISFDSKDGKNVSSITTKNKKIKADFVIFSVGFKPATQFLANTKIKTLPNGAILTDAFQQSNIKDIYAIGDCCAVFSNALQDFTYIALATNAIRTAIVAASSVFGIKFPINGVQGSNAIHIYDQTLCSTGITESFAKKQGFDVGSVSIDDFQKPTFMKENFKVMIKLVYDKQTRRLLGAQIGAKYDVTLAIHIYSLAIQEGLTIDRLKLLDMFFLPHFNTPFNVLSEVALKAK